MSAITSSNAEGQVVATIWAGGLKMPAASVASQIDQVASQAAGNYQKMAALHPPSEVAGPAGLLDAALLARSRAAAELRTAFTSVLGAAGTVADPSQAKGPSTTPATTAPRTAASAASQVAAVTAAAGDIQVGDQAYQLFVQSVPASLGVRMPASAWGGNLGPYQPAPAQAFLASLQSSAVTTPLYKVQVLGITTSPSPVTTSGTTQVLPDAKSMTTTVVIADTGNQPASRLTVTATISPAGSGTSSVRDFVSLQPGEAYTIPSFGPLDPPQGPPVTLTVTVTGSTGSPVPPATATLVFEMPAPPTPTSTTTTTPAG